MTLHPKGFHSDEYVLRAVDKILKEVDTFIETGTNVGSTAKYVAEHYPNIPVYSCEPNIKRYQKAINNTKHLKSVKLYRVKSPGFLDILHYKNPDLKSSLNFYFLDAHGFGHQWPLQGEIKFITENLQSAVILVDDVQVPDRSDFVYETYENQVCNLESIISFFNKSHHYTLCYPAYTEHTSPYAPLRGYMFISFGKRSEGLLESFAGEDFSVSSIVI